MLCTEGSLWPGTAVGLMQQLHFLAYEIWMYLSGAGEFEAMQDAIGTGSVDQAEMLGRLISRVASLEAAVAESQCVRRSLHNQLVNLRGNVRSPVSAKCSCVYFKLCKLDKLKLQPSELDEDLKRMSCHVP